MLINSTPLYNTLLIYAILIIVILIIKPSFMYDSEEGKFKSFGLNNNETIFSFGFVVIGGAIIIYLIFLMLWTSGLEKHIDSVSS